MTYDPNAEHVTHKVQVARDGKPYTGTYIVEGGIITVQFRGRDKVETLSGVEPESKARMMLGEMVGSHPDGHDSDMGVGLDPDARTPAFAQRPIRRDWSPQPADDLEFDLEEDEKHLLQCLGASVLLQWNGLSNEMHRAIFETAIAVMESDQSDNLRHQLALFLHDHKDDWTH